MNEPRRLLEDPTLSEQTRELLGALPTPTPLAGADRTAIASRVSTSLAAPAAAAKVLSLKALGVLTVVVVGGAAVSVAVVTKSEHAQPHASSVPNAAPVTRAPPERTLAPTPAPEPASTERVPAVKAPVPSARAASRRDTLALEASLLEQARQSIESPAKALSLLREHERRFPNGELTAERLYLTARAHARAGNATAARRYAKLLVDRFPKSTYVPRVRELLQ